MSIGGFGPHFNYKETIMNILNFIYEVTTHTLKFYRAVMELNCLSDAELKDLGISRGEIAYTVFQAQIPNK